MNFYNYKNTQFKMKLSLVILLLLVLIDSISGLIVQKKLADKRYPGVCYPMHRRQGKKRKWDLIYVPPGKIIQDENVCGIAVCLNPEGDVIVYYCPRPIPMSHCRESAQVNTRIIFPECCWVCADKADCVPEMEFPIYPYPPKTPVPPLESFP